MMTNKDDFIKKVIIGTFVFLFLFTIAMIVVFCITGSTPDVLIGAVFAACVGEYSICGMIKKTKEVELTERLRDGSLELYDEYEEDTEEEEAEDVVAAMERFECVDEYISRAHDGDIEEEAID
jgi:hypothetical protein